MHPPQSITDANGTTLYSWNARNQLVGINGPTVNASFLYDGIGRRETKTINGSLTEFLYDGVNPVQESSGAIVLANILTGLGIDEYFTRTDVGAGITSILLNDALGSMIALADSAGTVQTENTYEPFGKTTVTGSSNTSPFQYTGRENDGTGLYYYRARYHNPIIQRFISEDPILSPANPFAHALSRLLVGEPSRLHGYSYVANNAINFRDPSGLDPNACFRLRTNAFLNCLRDMFTPSTPMLDPLAMIASCGLCMALLDFGIFDPYSCGVCGAHVGYYGYSLIRCAIEADKIPCPKC